jgi:hypothetical protein
MDLQGGDMRKLFAVTVLSLLAALAVPSLALATHSNGQGPAQDFISGAAKGPIATGQNCLPAQSAPGHFHTNAQAEDNVTNVARGQFFTDIFFNPPCLGLTSVSFDGTVQCLNAFTGPDGNGANWSAVIEHVLTQPGGGGGVPGVLFPGMGVISRHVDNGEPGVGNDRALGFAIANPIPCNHPFLFVPFQTFPITQGNLVVHQGH